MVKNILDELVTKMMNNAEVKLSLTMNHNRSFPFYIERLSRKLRIKMACRLAAKTLVHDAFEKVGKFLKTE